MWCSVLCVSFLVLLSNIYLNYAFAQVKIDEWVELTQIYTGSYIDRPFLVPDPTGNLHLLWAGRAIDQGKDSPSVIFYARWDGTHWTPPTDVTVGPNGNDVQLPEAVADASGTLHLIWTSPQLYYSAAPAWAAENPRHWSPPLEISDGKDVISPAGIAIAPDEILHVVFAASSSGEIYHTSSPNSGCNWIIPKQIYVAPEGKAPHMTRLAIDPEGILHIVWTESPLPDGYPPSGVFYARSNDGGLNWSLPTELAGIDYGEAALVVAQDGKIYVAYNGRAGVGGKYHRWSDNGGLTWSMPIEVIPQGIGGLDGHPGLGVDSTGTLYFIGSGVDRHAVVSEWHNRGWSPLQDLNTLAPIALDFIEQPSLGIIRGNQLHVVFWDGRTRLWHTWRFVDAPVQVPISYPTIQPSPTFVKTATPEFGGTPIVSSPPTLLSINKGQLPLTTNPVYFVLISTVPSILITLIVLLTSLARRRT